MSVFITRAADIERIEDARDEKGAPWVVFKTKRILNEYEAYSQYYPRDKFPRVLSGSDMGVGYEMNVFASGHARFGKSPELPHIDQNKVPWIWVFDPGTFDDDYFAITKNYGGAIIEADNEKELISAIESYAKTFKPEKPIAFPTPGEPYKPPTSDPKPPPPPPAIDPSKVEPLPATEADTIKKGWAVATKKAASPVIAQAHVALGWMESHLGTKGQFLLAGNVPSWNWGAVAAREGQQFFLGTGNTSNFKFARFNTMTEGYDNFAGLSTIAVANKYFASGDVLGAVSVMYDRHYFVVNGDGRTVPERASHIREYANAVLGSAKHVASVTGQKMMLHGDGEILPPPAGTPSGEGGGGLLVAGGLVAAGIWWFTRK